MTNKVTVRSTEEFQPMLRHLPRTLVAASLLAVAFGSAAACGTASAEAVPAPSSAAPTTAPITAPPTKTAPKPAPTLAPHTTSCQGAVKYTIKANKTRPSMKRLCISVGGVLRVENLESSGMRIRPAANVSCWYEAAVTECRLIRPGTHTVVINGFHWTYSFTMVVTKAPSPPRSSPACLGAVVHTVDASESGPPWSALCLRVGGVLRFTNHGPEGFTVDPRATVSCWYEGGTRECRLIRAGTVTFKVTHPNGIRPLIVVAIP